MPAPFPADHPRGALLRRKGFNAWRDLNDPERIALPELADDVEAVFARLDAVNVWLTQVLED